MRSPVWTIEDLREYGDPGGWWYGFIRYEGKLHFAELSLYGHGYDWSVKFRQAGDPDSWGATRPHMTPEDAAYAALTMIEEHDREVYEENLIEGVA